MVPGPGIDTRRPAVNTIPKRLVFWVSGRAHLGRQSTPRMDAPLREAKKKRDAGMERRVSQFKVHALEEKEKGLRFASTIAFHLGNTVSKIIKT